VPNNSRVPGSGVTVEDAAFTATSSTYHSLGEVFPLMVNVSEPNPVKENVYSVQEPEAR
jgi:hypothetical protein